MSTNEALGRSQLAWIYGVQPETITMWSKQPTFPRPVNPDVKRGKKWDRAEVAGWVEQNCERSATYGGWRLKADVRRVVYLFWAKDREQCPECKSTIAVGQRCARTVSGRNIHEECAS